MSAIPMDVRIRGCLRLWITIAKRVAVVQDGRRVRHGCKMRWGLCYDNICTVVFVSRRFSGLPVDHEKEWNIQVTQRQVLLPTASSSFGACNIFTCSR